MRKLLALVISAMTLVALLPAASAAPPPQQRQVHTYRFTGAGPSILYVKGTLLAQGAPALLSVIYTDDDPRTGRPRSAMLTDVYEFGADGTSVYGANDDLGCVAPLRCTVDASGGEIAFSIFYDLDAPVPVAFTVRVVTQAARVRITDRVLERWRATHRSGGYTQVTAADATADGVATSGTSAEVLREASARGGRRGSIAVAVPPCDVGVGRMRLDGGRAPVEIGCPTRAVTAFADRATTWRLSGLAAGTASAGTRLLVIDG